VPSLAAAKEVVDGTAWALTRKLASLWPGPLTLVLPPSDRLPNKVKKALTRATGGIGIRVSNDPLAGPLVRSFAGPVLLSSANLEQKPGATSAATVRQRFQAAVDVWVYAGDTAPEGPSTIVGVREDGWEVVRDGAISRAAIERAVG
jgi:L-threonylcarbamoyladenylate synthase